MGFDNLQRAIRKNENYYIRCIAPTNERLPGVIQQSIPGSITVLRFSLCAEYDSETL